MGGARFVFCVHNHQPVGNFDHVFQQTIEDAYLPFLDVMERHPKIKFCAHYSGCLLEWMEKNRLELFIKIRNMVDKGRLELLSGGFYEPIFSMLPEGDTLGQIEMMNEYLRKHFGAEPQGLWLAERVWEPHLASLLARSGLRYSVLDDFHFRAAGLRDEELVGHYVTEDQGALFRLFPIKERLRYAIPFEDPAKTMEYLRSYPEGTVVTYADDGEKFGSWPMTKKTVYEEGWLERFLQGLEEFQTVTFSETLSDPPRGRVYLPTCSYREMGEWSLLQQSRAEYEGLLDDLRDRGKFEMAKPFLIGGLWRNFRVKYSEANLMYGRMLDVSRRVAASGSRTARQELYRAQCNCGHWHGIFGGLYLPHLREAVYRHLILAENELEPGMFGAKRVDLDLDGSEELRLTNRALNLFMDPLRGAQIVGLDVRSKALNLGATLARRPEQYHEVIRRKTKSDDGLRSIHDLQVSKQDGLEKYLQYDVHGRTSLVDHFFASDAAGLDCAKDCGDFVTGAYSSKTGKQGDALLATFRRDGTVQGKSGPVPVRVDKEVALAGEEGAFQVSYTITAQEPLETTFAVEFNVAMLNPEGFVNSRPEAPLTALRVHDSWHDLDVELTAAGAGGIWVQPIHTASQSESGYELNHQEMAVAPWWRLRIDPGRPWQCAITFKAGGGARHE